ncbi:MAG: helix-hairpin-helix domain-containing protein, partial [Ktedonobacterales bacterium]
MAASEKVTVVSTLRHIPSVGASIAEDLWNIGVRSLADLAGRDPQDLYDRLCTQ